MSSKKIDRALIKDPIGIYMYQEDLNFVNNEMEAKKNALRGCARLDQ